MKEKICKNCCHWQPNGGVLGVGYCTVQKWVYKKPSQTCKKFKEEGDYLILYSAKIDGKWCPDMQFAGHGTRSDVIARFDMDGGTNERR